MKAERQSGRTTDQMKMAPKGAVYVWLNNNLNYPRRLSETLGRRDLEIVAPSWLLNQKEKLLGTKTYPEMIYDHAIEMRDFSMRHWEGVDALIEHKRRIDSYNKTS